MKQGIDVLFHIAFEKHFAHQALVPGGVRVGQIPTELSRIDRDEVREAFKKAGVTVLAGDWTNGEPEITRFLESRGRAGVPLYLWYEPGRGVEELPQILTPSMLIDRARRPRR